MLVDEVAQAHAGSLAASRNAWPAGGEKAVVVGPAKQVADLAGKDCRDWRKIPSAKPRAFAFAGRDDGVLVAGNDERGVLFGVGYLLRKLHMNLGQDHARRRSRRRHRAQVSAARSSAWLSSQDQQLRRLGPAAVGAILSRPGRVRLQRGRVDSAAQRRRRHQPALSAAADGNDDRHVARWPTSMAWTCGSGIRRWTRTIRDPKTVEFALAEWEEVYKAAAADRRDLRARRRSRAHAAQVLDGAAGKADRAAAQVSSQGADVDVAAELQRDAGWTSFSRS